MSGQDPLTEVCVVGTPDTGRVVGTTAAPGGHATTADTGAIAAISARTNAKTRTAEVEAITQAAPREIGPSHLARAGETEAAKTRIASGATVLMDEAGQLRTAGDLVLRDVRPLQMSSSCSSKR